MQTPSTVTSIELFHNEDAIDMEDQLLHVASSTKEVIATSFDNEEDSATSPKFPSRTSAAEEIRAWILHNARASTIRNVIPKYTDLQYAPILSESMENYILLKREDQLPVFSFKLRGAYNKLTNIPPELLQKGVCAVSAGNHAQGVAFSARHLGISAKIFMPRGAPKIKVDNVKRLDAEVVLVGDSLEECMEACNACVSEEDKLLIHPFDDPYIIAGQATIGLELAEQTDLSKIDYIFVCCGGGGLLSGLGSVCKSISSHTKLIGVEADEAAGMTESLKQGKVVSLPTVGRFADGAAVKTVGDYTFNICKDVVDEMVIVSTSEICSAIADAFSELRVILEPAGALSIAGLRQYTAKYNIKNKRCIAICSGANMDFKVLKFVAEMADKAEHMISVLLPEYPGSFKHFFNLVENFSNLEITGIIYHQAHSRTSTHSNVTFNFRTIFDSDEMELLSALDEKGYRPIELSQCPVALLHGRYIMCGRDLLLRNEEILRFEFPNRGRALSHIFNELVDDWNVTLIHYRHYGSDMCSLLMGIDLPDDIVYTPQKEYFFSNLRSFGIHVSYETCNPYLSRLIPSV